MHATNPTITGCAAAGCAKAIEDHKFLCGRHWQLVPPKLHLRLKNAIFEGHADNAAAREDLHDVQERVKDYFSTVWQADRKLRRGR